MTTSTGSWWLWTGCAAVGVYTYYSLRPKPRGAADDTDFAGFLADPSSLAAPTARAAPPRDETGFDAFLRVLPTAPAADPTGFDSFLRVKPAVAGGAAPPGAAEQQAKQEEAAPLDRAGVAVLFGTEYGFSKEIAEKLCAELKAGGAFWPRLVNMADHPEGYDLAAEQAVLIACSTQGDGVPPTEARDFCDWLLAGKAGALPNLSYSVLALGDKSYPHFCRCGKQLDAALAAAGAREMAARVDVDKEDWGAVDGWIEVVQAALPGLGLKSLAETGGGAAPASTAPAAAAAKRYSKARPYFAPVRALQGLCVIADKAADKDTVRVELDLGDSGLTYAPGDALGVYPTNSAEAVSELLAALGASGDEAVQVPSWHYQEPEAHSTLIQGATGAPSMPLRAALARCYDLRSPKGDALLRALQAALPLPDGNGDAAAATNGPLANGGTAAAAAHTNGGDAAAPRPAAGSVAEQAAELARLLGDKGALEAYLGPRHVIDVIQDFAAAALTHQQLLPALRQLQPRLYSISSSPLEDPRGVQATIAVVRYEALGAGRVGVCSTFVAERTQLGDVAPVFISKNPDFRLPPDPATPVIMVGPGTGLAPFRSFIVHRLIEAGADPATVGAAAEVQQEQQQQQQQKKGGENGHTKPKAANGVAANGVAANGSLAAAYEATSGAAMNGAADVVASSGDQGQQRRWGFGPTVLYFGCRRRDQDYLYGSDLERWAAAGAIELHTAFSREPGRPKVYVQQRLEESADRVWELLEAGAHFYVCGDANSMAGAVEHALLRIIAARLPGAGEGGDGGEAGARAYLQRLSDAHRYERDVWFS